MAVASASDVKYKEKNAVSPDVSSILSLYVDVQLHSKRSLGSNTVTFLYGKF